jgi:hypothetical protein
VSTPDTAPRDGGTAYLMRRLVTPADREAAAALVQDRALQLAEHGINLPAEHAAVFRDPQAEALGLYDQNADEDILVGCLVLRRKASTLTLPLAYTAPRPDSHVGLLMTLWAADYAARLDLQGVTAEAPVHHGAPGDASNRLLSHLETRGWRHIGSRRDAAGTLTAVLWLPAQASPAVGLLVTCHVPITTPGTTAERNVQ